MDLRETIMAASESTPEEETTPAVSAPVAESAPAPVESQGTSDEQSSASSDGASEPAAAEHSNSGVKSIEEVAEAAPVESAPSDPRIDRAPSSWKGDAKKVWATLPLQARQEVIRRERDTLRVIQENAGYKGRVESIQKVVDQNREVLQRQYNGDPVAALNNMMVVDRNLTSGTPQSKAEFVAHIINHFGIDIATLDAVLSKSPLPPQAQQQTDLERLLDQRLAPVMTYVQRQQLAEQQSAQQVEQQAAQTVEQMASDPAYPYFDEVRDEMADFIEMASKRGVGLSLHDAYEKAVRSNDGIFAASNARNNVAGSTQQALAAHQQAQRAKGASVSVSGSPNGVPNGSHADPSDLRATIMSQFGDTGVRV